MEFEESACLSSIGEQFGVEISDESFKKDLSNKSLSKGLTGESLEVDSASGVKFTVNVIKDINSPSSKQEKEREIMNKSIQK